MWKRILWNCLSSKFSNEKAKIIHTGETVAIKKVYQDKRYKNREYALTKELNHPNIVKLLHAFYTTGEKVRTN